MWIMWVVAIIAVLVMIRFLFGNYHCTKKESSAEDAGCGNCSGAPSSDEDALDVLKKRFANGEIDADAFEKMKKTLEVGN